MTSIGLALPHIVQVVLGPQLMYVQSWQIHFKEPVTAISKNCPAQFEGVFLPKDCYKVPMSLLATSPKKEKKTEDTASAKNRLSSKA